MPTIVCSNKWCKSHFAVQEGEESNVCPRCKSMATELSAGVTWVDKTYDGPRMDGMPHQVRIKVNKYTR